MTKQIELHNLEIDKNISQEWIDKVGSMTMIIYKEWENKWKKELFIGKNNIWMYDVIDFIECWIFFTYNYIKEDLHSPVFVNYYYYDWTKIGNFFDWVFLRDWRIQYYPYNWWYDKYYEVDKNLLLW